LSYHLPRPSGAAAKRKEIELALNELSVFVFMLATFLGLELIRRVSPLLHTPLMSLTNAISAISVVGAILITGEKDASTLSRVLGFIAVTAATTNVVSGYLITDRMLKMFKKRDDKR
jgi:NAD(P) transhydrogenase subunit alpha